MFHYFLLWGLKSWKTRNEGYKCFDLLLLLQVKTSVKNIKTIECVQRIRTIVVLLAKRIHGCWCLKEDCMENIQQQR